MRGELNGNSITVNCIWHLELKLSLLTSFQRDETHSFKEQEKFSLVHTSLYIEFYKPSHIYHLLVADKLSPYGNLSILDKCLCARVVCDIVFILHWDSWDCWNRCKKTVLICRIFLLGNKLFFTIVAILFS